MMVINSSLSVSVYGKVQYSFVQAAAAWFNAAPILLCIKELVRGVASHPIHPPPGSAPAQVKY